MPDVKVPWAYVKSFVTVEMEAEISRVAQIVVEDARMAFACKDKECFGKPVLETWPLEVIRGSVDKGIVTYHIWRHPGLASGDDLIDGDTSEHPALRSGDAIELLIARLRRR